MTAVIGAGAPYLASGCRLDGSIEQGDVQWLAQTANTTINVNAACLFVSGYVSSNTTTLAATFAGIAMATQVITAQTTPVTQIPILTPNRNKYFWVPVGSASAVVTQAAVGTICDFDATGQAINLTANSPTAFGFQITDFDISTMALAANAKGYVRGRFIPASE